MATVLRRLMVSAGWADKIPSEPGSSVREPGSNPQREDRVEIDAWLLPPLPLTRGERLIRLISITSGPVLLVAVAGLLLWLLFA